MTRRTVIITATLLLVSCSPKVYPSASEDSVRIEYRDRLVYDTVYVEIPREVERIVTMDTTSTLTNSYATSTATVSSGLLSHSLETRPGKIAAPVTYVVHDTSYVQIKADTVTEYVDKELSWWQKFKMEFGGIFLGLMVGLLVALVIKIFI